jgi:hypothetical protein
MACSNVLRIIISALCTHAASNAAAGCGNTVEQQTAASPLSDSLLLLRQLNVDKQNQTWLPLSEQQPSVCASLDYA